MSAIAEEPADPIQRIIASASVPGGLLLHPPAHVVDGGEAEPGHVERVQHPDRLGQAGAQRGRVAAGRIERGDRDVFAPTVGLSGNPSGQRFRCVR